MFFSQDEQQKIRKAVQNAERKTSGELVPMLVCDSHSYPLAAVRGGGLVALILSILLTETVAGMFWLHASNMWIFLCLFFPLYWLANMLISKNPVLKRPFLFNDEMNTEVQHAALAAFFKEHLYKTRDDNGILIYISLLEHRAWILADSGINERIESEEWDAAMQVITNGIKEDHACDSLCQAIEMIGTILESEFPVRDDDQNELHDLIIR
jgi:putative membrane protein